jgi:anti-anti-sigma factor
VTEVPPAGGTDHVCWIYADDESFDVAVARFLTAGLARGERLLCVGDDVVERMRGDHPLLPDAAGLVERGALQLLTVAEAYDAAGAFSPERQFAYYEAQTRRALDDGYTGLRVVAELTPLAADEERRPELVRWEHMADAFMASSSGMTAMCAYRAQLSGEALADVAAVHPVVHNDEGGHSGFRVFFDDDRVVLAGSVDTFTAGRLAGVLATSPVTSGRVALDLDPVEFVDVAGIRVLARWARELSDRSVEVEIRGASPLVRRMWRVLGLDQLVPVPLQRTAE